MANHGVRDVSAFEQLPQVPGRLGETEASFRPLGPSDRAAARPWLLKVVPYPRGGFAELARQSPLNAHAEGQLRLLNGYYGGGEPRVGEPVKVVQ